MSWNAKTTGSYSLDSDEGKANVLAFVDYFVNSHSYKKHCVCGMLCNVYAESGLNPWRWQGDKINDEMTNGYGLFQYTPGSGYINSTQAQALKNYGPNTNLTAPNGKVSDALAQMNVFVNNKLGKWVGTSTKNGVGGWRSYWDKTTYATLYSEYQTIISTYGSDGKITMNQFKKIGDTRAACFVFLTAFEGPLTPNLDARMSYADTIWAIMKDEPEPPTPTGDWKYGGVRDIIRRLILHA